MIESIVIGIVVALIIGAIHIGIRNSLVCDFLHYTNHKSTNIMLDYLTTFRDDSEFHEHEAEYEKLDKIHNGIMDLSYTRVLFSFKGFKLENWFTPTELEFLEGKLTKRNSK